MAERTTIDRYNESETKQFESSWPSQVYLNEAGDLCERPVTQEYRLGNPDYPVSRYREYLVDTVKDNLLTIITAKTGTGKSTHVPQFLFESGSFDRVVVTQPRIVAARELKRYVSDEISKSLDDRSHDLVGFQTATEGEYSDENAILYVTDGLQLMHEISHHGVKPDQVLVIDEFHERSANMDALLAIAVEYGIRTVVMSATLDAKDISRHYSKIVGSEVPIIDIPGVTYEVEERESNDLDAEVIRASREGKNILVFLPGRKEIKATMSRLRRKLPKDYTLLQLHGDQTPDEQSKVFLSYPGGKIIFSTSVGQTSITIDDIDTVVDCGFERTATLSETGDYTLATQPSTRATLEQRRGRVGRTKDGEYIRAQLRGFPPLPDIDQTLDYDVSAIQRTRMDDMMLKLVSFGNSFESLPFYSHPSGLELDRTKERLNRIGLFKKLGKTALDGYAITPIGEQAARLPLDAHSARMVVEARQYGPDIELQMMAAVAVQQVNGITSTVKGNDKWRQLSTEHDSDILAGIDYLVGAMRSDESERDKKDIVALRYKKAFRAFEQLALRSHLNVYDLTSPNDEQREKLINSVIAGSDELFIRGGRTRGERVVYKDYHKKKRHPLASTSIESEPSMLVGTRFNLEEVRNTKIATHALISMASAVDVKSLMEIAPHRVKTIIQDFSMNDAGQAFTNELVYFDGHNTMQRISRSAESSEILQQYLIDQVFTDNHIKMKLPPNITEARRLISEARQLQNRTTENLGINESINEIVARTMREAPYNCQSFDDLDAFIATSVIREIIPDFIREEIMADSPDNIEILVDGQSMRLAVEYVAGSDRAHVTVMPQYYKSLPFEIGGHRVSVRPSRKAPYIDLEAARYNMSRPSREERRGFVPRPRVPGRGGRRINTSLPDTALRSFRRQSR